MEPPNIDRVLAGLNRITLNLSTRNLIGPNLIPQIDAAIAQAILAKIHIKAYKSEYQQRQELANWEHENPKPVYNPTYDATILRDYETINRGKELHYVGAARLRYQSPSAKDVRIRNVKKLLKTQYDRTYIPLEAQYNRDRTAFRDNNRINPEYVDLVNDLSNQLRNILEPQVEYRNLTVVDFQQALLRTTLIEVVRGVHEVGLSGEHQLPPNTEDHPYYSPGGPNAIFNSPDVPTLLDVYGYIRSLRIRGIHFELQFTPTIIGEADSVWTRHDTRRVVMRTENMQRFITEMRELGNATLEQYEGDNNIWTDVRIYVIHALINPRIRRPRGGGFWHRYPTTKVYDDLTIYHDSNLDIGTVLNSCNLYFEHDKLRFKQGSCLHKAFSYFYDFKIYITCGGNDGFDIGVSELRTIAEENEICISLKDERALYKTSVYGDRSNPKCYLYRADDHFIASYNLPPKHFRNPNGGYITTTEELFEFLRDNLDYSVPVPIDEAASLISAYIDNRIELGDRLDFTSMELTKKRAARLLKNREGKPLSKCMISRPLDGLAIEYDADFEASVDTLVHHPIAAVGISDVNRQPKRFMGEDCGLQLMEDILQTHIDNCQYFKDLCIRESKYITKDVWYIQLVKGVSYPKWLKDKFGYEKHVFHGEPEFAMRIYFHNLGYDKSYLAQILDKVTGFMGSGKSCKGFEGYYKGVKFYFRCNYALIPKALREFPKMFGLEDHKKWNFPYSIYPKDSMNNDHPDTMTYTHQEWTNAMETMDVEGRNEFMRTLITRDLVKIYPNRVIFLHKETMMLYCESDVILQRLGRIAFRAKLEEGTGYKSRPQQDITISGIAKSINTMGGSYDGVEELEGAPSEFVRKHICHGGRCLMRNNKKQFAHMKMCYVDFNSLYPSSQICIGGYLKGIPKVIPPEWLLGKYTNLDRMANDDHYGIFVNLEVYNIPIKRPFPLIYRERNGLREYTNECSKEDPIEYGVERWGWQILTKFFGCRPGIDFKVISGLYFDEGRQNKLKSTLDRLYWLRKDYQAKAKLKVEGAGSVSEVLKLVLNSTWGKDMQKTFYDSISIEDIDDVREASSHPMNTIYGYSHFTQDGSKVLCTRAKKIKPSSRSFCAAEVLGCSKYKMCQFLVVCDDLGVYVGYSDTDSAIMDATRYEEVRARFKEVYGFEVDGEHCARKNEPGTLHPDFDSDDTIYGTEFIAVCKKGYYLKCRQAIKEKDGYGYEFKDHEQFKFKGMSDPKNTIKRYMEPRKFYKSLLRGVVHYVPQTYKYSKPSFGHNPKTWQYTTNENVVKRFVCPGDVEEWDQDYTIERIPIILPTEVEPKIKEPVDIELLGAIIDEISETKEQKILRKQEIFNLYDTELSNKRFIVVDGRVKVS
jgi:hypothetical protein